jgi:hypothetical protein
MECTYKNKNARKNPGAVEMVEKANKERTMPNRDAHIAMFNTMTSVWQSTIRYQVMINGGACVALLAFIGAVYDSSGSLVRLLSIALLCFGMGVLSGALCCMFRYKSIIAGRDKDKKAQARYTNASTSSGDFSFVLFGLGGIIVVWALGWGA